MWSRVLPRAVRTFAQYGQETSDRRTKTLATPTVPYGLANVNLTLPLPSSTAESWSQAASAKAVEQRNTVEHRAKDGKAEGRSTVERPHEEEAAAADTTVSEEESMGSKTREQYVQKEYKKRLQEEGAAPTSMSAFKAISSAMNERAAAYGAQPLKHHSLSRHSSPSKTTSSGASPSTSSSSTTTAVHQQQQPTLSPPPSTAPSLEGMSVSLFNFHRTEYAERLLQQGLTNLVLVESSQHHAQRAKNFARAVRRQSSSSGVNVQAWHASHLSLFGVDRKKKEEPEKVVKKGKSKKKAPPALVYSFPSQLVARPEKDEGIVPLRLKEAGSRALTHRTGAPAPILVCALPLATQQDAVLTAITRSLLQHHGRSRVTGLYALGDVQFATFLHAEQAAHLLCAADANLSFLSHSVRAEAQLLAKLFHIKQLGEPFVLKSFDPHLMKPTKKMAHAAKMHEAGFTAARFFGISITPRLHVTIGGRDVLSVESVDDSMTSVHDTTPEPLAGRVLATFAVWSRLMGKQPMKRKMGEALSEIAPGSAASVQRIVSLEERVCEVPSVTMESAFLAALEELNGSVEIVQRVDEMLEAQQAKQV